MREMLDQVYEHRHDCSFQNVIYKHSSIIMISMLTILLPVGDVILYMLSYPDC